MRAALWLVALFALAVGLALFAGNNQGTVTLFWPPWRVDVSLNLAVLVLVGTFFLLYAALRVMAALFGMPAQARRWRNQQKERAMHAGLLDAFSHLLAGRFIRSRKAAQAVLAQQRSLNSEGDVARAPQMRAIAHLLAAESAQALQDKTSRDEHLQLALEHTASREAQETREGAQLRAARWALEDHDPQAAMNWLKDLPHGAARRTLALRIKLKSARLLRQSDVALETARVLARHRAFSAAASQSIVRGLAIDLLDGAFDVAQLQRVWASLEDGERAMPELAIHAAQRVHGLGGEAALSRQWLQPVWQHYPELGDSLRIKLVRALELSLDSIDPVWLAGIETAQLHHPRDANLQYLSGMACLRRQLWGKAQLLLTQAAQGLQDPALCRQAWRALAELAEQRGDQLAAQQAFRRAAEI